MTAPPAPGANGSSADPPMGFSVADVAVPRGTYRLVVRRLVGGVFTADADAVRLLLPTPELHPIRVLPGKTAVFINCTDADHHIASLPPIRCASLLIMAVATPGAKPGPYLTPVLSDAATIRHRAGLVVLASVSTSRVISEFSRVTFGWPGIVGDISNRQGPGFETFTASADGRLIAQVGIRPTESPEQWGPTFWTYGVRDGQVLGWRMDMRATTTQLRYGPRSSRMRLGDHPAVAHIHELGLSPKGLIGSFHTDGERIIDQPPFALGPALIAAPPPAPPHPADGRLMIVDPDGHRDTLTGLSAAVPFDPTQAFQAEPLSAAPG